MFVFGRCRTTGNLWKQVGTIKLKELEYKLIELAAISNGSSGLKQGDIYYNPNTKLLRQYNGTSSSNIPFEHGALYHYNNILLKWNGTDMVVINFNNNYLYPATEKDLNLFLNGYFSFLKGAYIDIEVENGYDYYLTSVNIDNKSAQLYKEKDGTRTLVYNFNINATYGIYTILTTNNSYSSYIICDFNELKANTGSINASMGISINPSVFKSNLKNESLFNYIYAGIGTPSKRLIEYGMFKFVLDAYIPITIKNDCGYLLGSINKTNKSLQLYEKSISDDGKTVNSSLMNFTEKGTIGDYSIMGTSSNQDAYIIVNFNAISSDTLTSILPSEGSCLNPKIFYKQKFRNTIDELYKAVFFTDISSLKVDGALSFTETTIGNPSTPSNINNTGWEHIITNCNIGDSFVITANGGNSYRAYAIVDSEGILRLISNAGYDAKEDQITSNWNGTLYVNNEKSIGDLQVIKSSNKIDNINNTLSKSTETINPTETKDGCYIDTNYVINNNQGSRNVNFYNIENIYEINLSITSTGSSASLNYGFANSLDSIALFDSGSPIGNGGAFNATIYNKHNYKYLVVTYNNGSNVFVTYTKNDYALKSYGSQFGYVSEKRLDTIFNRLKLSEIKLKESPIKLLFYGNSYCELSTLYLPQLFEALGYEVIIGANIIGGSELSGRDNLKENKSSTTTFKLYEKKKWTTLNLNMIDSLLYYDWDIVSYQQRSIKAGLLSTYNPFLSNLFEWTKINIGSAGYRLNLFMPWAHSIPLDDINSAETNQEMYENIANTTREVVEQFDELNILICPAGTAVQNQQNYYKLMPDGEVWTNEIFNSDDREHCTIIGYYASTCTIFEIYSQYLVGKGLNELEYSDSSNWGTETITEELWNNSKISALNAVKTPYSKTDII